jgi:hypothetical protein
MNATDDLNKTTAAHSSSAAVEKKKKSCCPVDGCKYRMKLADTISVCRCGVSYCPSHRYPDEHRCSYNYRAAATELLSTQMVKCVGDRLEKI